MNNEPRIAKTDGIWDEKRLRIATEAAGVALWYGLGMLIMIDSLWMSTHSAYGQYRKKIWLRLRNFQAVFIQKTLIRCSLVS